MSADIGKGDWSRSRRAPGEPLSIAWFMDRVEFDANGGCWLWAAGVRGNGYGNLSNPPGSTQLAHRASWVLFRGNIPSDREICHRCDVRSCVNPNHLFLGTRSDNMRDCASKGRSNAPVGERAGNSVLTADQVMEIARAVRQRIPLKRYARENQISLQLVRNVATGRTWRWLTGLPDPLSTPVREKADA